VVKNTTSAPVRNVPNAKEFHATRSPVHNTNWRTAGPSQHQRRRDDNIWPRQADAKSVSHLSQLGKGVFHLPLRKSHLRIYPLSSWKKVRSKANWHEARVKKYDTKSRGRVVVASKSPAGQSVQRVSKPPPINRHGPKLNDQRRYWSYKLQVRLPPARKSAFNLWRQNLVLPSAGQDRVSGVARQHAARSDTSRPALSSIWRRIFTGNKPRLNQFRPQSASSLRNPAAARRVKPRARWFAWETPFNVLWSNFAHSLGDKTTKSHVKLSSLWRPFLKARRPVDGHMSPDALPDLSRDQLRSRDFTASGDVSRLPGDDTVGTRSRVKSTGSGGVRHRKRSGTARNVDIYDETVDWKILGKAVGEDVDNLLGFLRPGSHRRRRHRRSVSPSETLKTSSRRTRDEDEDDDDDDDELHRRDADDDYFSDEELQAVFFHLQCYFTSA